VYRRIAYVLLFYGLNGLSQPQSTNRQLVSLPFDHLLLDIELFWPTWPRGIPIPSRSFVLFMATMAVSESIAGFPVLSSASEVILSTQGQMSRWSNLGIPPDGCAAIVVPSKEEDIISVIRFAAQQDFKVLPTAGKHGSFLPINERSIYLDLKSFDSVELDEQLGCVKIGGGVVTGRMCSTLAGRGWYTSKFTCV